MLLRVDYETTPNEPVLYRAIHVLDSDYRPTGPDLTPLLHDLVLVDKEPQPDGTQEAQRFLSLISEELQ